MAIKTRNLRRAFLLGSVGRALRLWRGTDAWRVKPPHPAHPAHLPAICHSSATSPSAIGIEQVVNTAEAKTSGGSLFGFGSRQVAGCVVESRGSGFASHVGPRLACDWPLVSHRENLEYYCTQLTRPSDAHLGSPANTDSNTYTHTSFGAFCLTPPSTYVLVLRRFCD